MGRVRERTAPIGLALVVVVGALLYAAPTSGAAGHLSASPRACSGTRCDKAGTLELAGSNWLGGSGVDIYSNGDSALNDNGASCFSVKGGTGGGGGCKAGTVYLGQKWQCVEVINRLYHAKGWIGANTIWWGNGNQMYDNAPSGLKKDPQKKIGSIAPGDVISLDDGGDGHAGVVNKVTKKSDGSFAVDIVNQNTPQVSSSATLKYDTLTMSGWKGYSVIGVVHAPTVKTPPTKFTAASPPAGMVGLPYYYKFKANGTPAPIFSVASGTLPPGLKLATNGELTGTPNTQYTFSFVIRASNKFGPLPSPKLSIYVRPNYENIVAPGTSNALNFYYNLWGKTPWPADGGPPGAPQSTSRPAIAISKNLGTVVAARGANGTLDFYYNLYATSGWDHDVVAGPGSLTGSPPITGSPSIAVMSNGDAGIAAQSVDGSLHFFFNKFGDNAWIDTPITDPGTLSDDASIASTPAGEWMIATRETGNTLWFHYKLASGTWQPGSFGAGTAYGAPSIASNSNGDAIIAVQGPSNSLQFRHDTFGQLWDRVVNVGGSGTAAYAPSVAYNIEGEFVIASTRNDGTLNFWYKFSSTGWSNPPDTVAAAGSTVGSPSIATMPSGEAVIAAEGPSGTLEFYWNAFTVSGWHPQHVASAGSIVGAPSIAVPPR